MYKERGVTDIPATWFPILVQIPDPSLMCNLLIITALTQITDNPFLITHIFPTGHPGANSSILPLLSTMKRTSYGICNHGGSKKRVLLRHSSKTSSIERAQFDRIANGCNKETREKTRLKTSKNSRIFAIWCLKTPSVAMVRQEGSVTAS